MNPGPLGQLWGRLRVVLGRLDVASVVLVVASCLQPYTSLLADNRGLLLSLRVLAGYWLVTAAVALAALVIVAACARDVPRWAVGIATAVLSFFNAHLWTSEYAAGARQAVQLVLWVVITAGLTVVAARLARSRSFRQFVTFFVALLAVIPLASYAIWHAGLPTVPSAVQPGDPLGPVEEVSRRPNVYWFILDEYGRSDQLDKFTGFDNAGFIADLRQRGFEVSETSRGSYVRTHLSLASTLQMTYVLEPGNDFVGEFRTFAPVVVGDNNVVRRFRELGYAFAYSDQGTLAWSDCASPPADVCLPARSPGISLDELQRTLVDRTPLGSIDLFDEHYTDPLWVLDTMDAVRGELGEPFFLQAHLFNPHWPQRFAEGCDTRSTPLRIQALPIDERTSAYVQDVECLDALLLEAADRIAADDPGAIVIMQGDHGTFFSISGWDLPPEEWTDANLTERLAPFNALSLPTECADLTIEGEPLVNTFRLVFACIESREPELLPYRAFLGPQEELDETVEIDADRVSPREPRRSGS